MKLYFLTLEELLKIHHDQISNYGGMHGVLSMGLLDSAIAQPKSQFQGDYLHQDIPQMAEAYAFHLCLNHPFFDGNKRTALVSTLLFLQLNRIEFVCDIFEIQELILDIAKKKITKSKTAQFINEHMI